MKIKKSYCIVIFFLLVSPIFAVESNFDLPVEQEYVTVPNDNNEGNNSGDMIPLENRKEGQTISNSGEASEKLSEEGANVDTSITQKNYKIEAPTIVLLTLFGILTFVAVLLFIFKI